jgi:hypothetical protein
MWTMERTPVNIQMHLLKMVVTTEGILIESMTGKTNPWMWRVKMMYSIFFLLMFTR